MHDLFEEPQQEKIDLKLWREILKFAKPFKRELLTLIAFVIGVALIDAIFPYMSKIAIDRFVVPQTTSGLGWFAAAFAVIVTAQALNVYAFIMTAGKVESGHSYEIRKAGFARLQELSLSGYGEKAVGWLMARMTSDINRLGNHLMGMCRSFLGSCQYGNLLGRDVLPQLAAGLSLYDCRAGLGSHQPRLSKAHTQRTSLGQADQLTHYRSIQRGYQRATTTKIMSREEENLQGIRRN